MSEEVRSESGNNIFDLKALRKELEEADVEEGFDGSKVKRIYIGTVFNWYPSGKFYTMWACGNLETCQDCSGEGCENCGYVGSKEAHEDSMWRDKVDEELNEIGAWLEHGEGDACDLFICMGVDDEETLAE